MPYISIIVPCYNEQDTIGLLLNAVYTQTYPRDKMEVVIADGNSTDQTRQAIERFQQDHADLQVRVVENRERTIPSGLNRALQAALGDLVVRLDAHSVPSPDYVLRCASALEAGCGDNVGGVWEIHPSGDGWMAKSIAIAVSHPLGAGDARYRIGGRAQAVDTVPFGAFRKSLVERIGFYDETLLTNEDYEFNVRIREAGGIVWMDPTIRSKYFARPSLGALWRQYWRYGYWKARMLRRHPHSLRWRQVIPPAFVLSLFVLALAGIWNPIFHWMMLAEGLTYLGILILAALPSAMKKRELLFLAGIPLAWATIHLAWGSSFLWGGIQSE